MIKTNLRDITLRDYAECLGGNTLILHKGIRLFKKRIQLKCDNTFSDISERLQDELKQSTSIIYKMFVKYRRSEVKLNAFVVGYQVLQIQKNETTIEHLKSFGWSYNNKRSHIDNLKALAGQIDRLKNITGQHEKDYISVVEDVSNKSRISIEEIISMLNKALGYPAINMQSSLQEFAAANLTAQKVNKK